MSKGLRRLMTRANGDRLLVYGSFIALFGGLMTIKALVISNDTASAIMVGWGSFMLVVVLVGMWLTRRPPNSQAPAPNQPKSFRN